MKQAGHFALTLLIILVAGCGFEAGSPTIVFTSTVSNAPPPTNTTEFSATPLHTEISTAEPGVIATSAAIALTVVAAGQPQVHSASLSPDKKWQAKVVIYDCALAEDGGQIAYEQLKLVQVSNGTETIIDSQLRYCGGVGAFGLGDLLWSSNSRYLYYTTAREGSPDGCGYWKPPIIRLDTFNQHLENLGGGLLSPDQTKLAAWRDHDLVVWDLNSGEIAHVSAIAPTADIGPIAWSPDSRSLVYLQTVSQCPAVKSYLVRLGLPKLSPTLLVESVSPTFSNVVWDTAGHLGLTDWQGQEWRYEFSTEELRSLP